MENFVKSVPAFLFKVQRFGKEIFRVFVGRHPNTSIHLTARTGGAFSKAVGAAGELGVTDISGPYTIEFPGIYEKYMYYCQFACNGELTNVLTNLIFMG